MSSMCCFAEAKSDDVSNGHKGSDNIKSVRAS